MVTATEMTDMRLNFATKIVRSVERNRGQVAVRAASDPRSRSGWATVGAAGVAGAVSNPLRNPLTEADIAARVTRRARYRLCNGIALHSPGSGH